LADTSRAAKYTGLPTAGTLKGLQERNFKQLSIWKI